VSILDGIKKFTKIKILKIIYSKGIDWNIKDFLTVPAEVLSSENQKGLKGSYFSNSDLKGNPAFEKQDEQLNFKWTLYSPNP
jgi:beta-glucosidase